MLRAETERLVDEIERSLGLLRQRLDWDTAPHRLEELDAMSEDPGLWSDPAKAQKLMRERQTLADAIAGYRELERELTDQREMVELGKAEGDAAVVVALLDRDQPAQPARGGAMPRTRLMSLVEAVANVVVGYSVAMLTRIGDTTALMA